MFHRLILAHLVGDFVLQNRWMVRRKRKLDGLAIHVGLVGVAMAPMVWHQLASWWPWLLAVLFLHGLTDWAKIHLEPHLQLPPILPFLADQALHVAIIALAAALSSPAGLVLSADGPELIWWVASAYVIATCAVSIALPLWLDPPSLTRRPPEARLLLILASALVLTLAWRGLPLLIPVVGLGLYQWVVRRMTRVTTTPTFPIEFLSAVMVAACLGWGLP